MMGRTANFMAIACAVAAQAPAQPTQNECTTSGIYSIRNAEITVKAWQRYQADDATTTTILPPRAWAEPPQIKGGFVPFEVGTYSSRYFTIPSAAVTAQLKI